MRIAVFRLGHRPFRDKRITTHVFLAGRALGASMGSYTGERDVELEGRINKVSVNFGGDFLIKYEKSWRGLIQDWRKIGKVVHLTMYGIPFEDVVDRLETDNLLVVVGGEKVPSELYKSVDYNVSITNQPHSEVSALGIFLYELTRRFGVKPEFQNSRFKIMPSNTGKDVKESNI